MPIDYGLQNINVAGMSAEYFNNARKIAELEFDATMKQNARLEQALTLENTSKLFGQMTEDVNKDYEELNKGLADKLRKANEEGAGFLTPMDWASVNTLKTRITDKINKYNTFIDAYQKSSEELITNSKKYHGRTSKDNLLSFSENPLEYINTHKSPTFLTPSVVGFDEIIGKYGTLYKDNTSYTKDVKSGYGKVRSDKFEGNVSMFNTDSKGKVLSMKNDNEQLKQAVGNLIGMAKGNDEYNRSMQTTYEDIKLLDPERISQIDAKAAQMYPDDAEAQAYARGALTLIDGNDKFYRARQLEGQKVVREPKGTGGAGDKKVFGIEEGIDTDFSITGLISGIQYKGKGKSSDISGLGAVKLAGPQGRGVSFKPERKITTESGQEYVVGTSFVPEVKTFKTENEALGEAASASTYGKLFYENENFTVGAVKVNVPGKAPYWRVDSFKPTKDVGLPVEDFNKQSKKKVQQTSTRRTKAQPQSTAPTKPQGKTAASKVLGRYSAPKQ